VRGCHGYRVTVGVLDEAGNRPADIRLDVP